MAVFVHDFSTTIAIWADYLNKCVPDISLKCIVWIIHNYWFASGFIRTVQRIFKNDCTAINITDIFKQLSYTWHPWIVHLFSHNRFGSMHFIEVDSALFMQSSRWSQTVSWLANDINDNGWINDISFVPQQFHYNIWIK